MFILRRELKDLEDRLAKAEEKLHRLSADNFIRMDDPKDTRLASSGDSVKNTLVNLMSHFNLEPFIPHRSDVGFRVKQTKVKCPQCGKSVKKFLSCLSGSEGGIL